MAYYTPGQPYKSDDVDRRYGYQPGYEGKTAQTGPRNSNKTSGGTSSSSAPKAPSTPKAPSASSAGSASSSSSGGDSDSYYDEARRLAREQQRAAERAQQAAIESAVDRLNAQKPILQQQREQAAQEAYIRQQQALMNLPQQMSAAGIANSGLAESSLVGLDTSYGNQVNEITRAYQNALNDLNTNIAQVRANGDTSLADLEADYLKQVQNISLQQAQAAEAQRLQQQEYAARLAMQSAGNSSNNFSRMMALYEATGDETYLKLANNELGIQYTPQTNNYQGYADDFMVRLENARKLNPNIDPQEYLYSYVNANNLSESTLAQLSALLGYNNGGNVNARYGWQPL